MSHNIRDLVVKAAAVKAVEDAVAKAKAEVKAALESALDPGDRKHAMIDGSSAATITYATSQADARVTNHHDFQAWVQATHPEEMESVPVEVDPEDLAWVVGMRDPNPDGPDNGQMASDYRDAFDRLVKAVQGSRQRVRPTFVSRVLADAKTDKVAVDRTTGEQIPGVTYTPGGAGTYVTTRQSDDQADVLREAWQSGKIDPVTLALTPLAELEASK
jgi:hypothetical protein